MIKQKIETNFYGEQAYLEDDQTGNEYQRIVGGLGFSCGDKPGFAVIVGEERVKKYHRKPNFWVLTEHEDFNVSNLLLACTALGRKFHVSQWYGDTGNRPMMEFVYKLKIPLSLTSAPFIDDPNALNSYIAQIRGCTTPGKKRLHLGNSSLGTRLLEIPAEKIRRATKAQDFPMLVALGGTLTALITWQYDPDEQRRCDKLNEELLIDFDF
jgi:hypothetical protein